jgi:hypothetical protein
VTTKRSAFQPTLWQPLYQPARSPYTPGPVAPSFPQSTSSFSHLPSIKSPSTFITISTSTDSSIQTRRISGPMVAYFNASSTSRTTIAIV